jgi:hypothetical protein
VSIKWYSVTHTGIVKILTYKFLFSVFNSISCTSPVLFSTGDASCKLERMIVVMLKFKFETTFCFEDSDFLGYDLSKLVNSYQNFGGACCLHFQGPSIASVFRVQVGML